MSWCLLFIWCILTLLAYAKGKEKQQNILVGIGDKIWFSYPVDNGLNLPYLLVMFCQYCGLKLHFYIHMFECVHMKSPSIVSW